MAPEVSHQDSEPKSKSRSSSSRQIWLLEYQNPLKEKLGTKFFSKIPTGPGVYWMTGASKEILYVGKAKNLRNRLRSYSTAKPGSASRKTIRLIRRVREIHWEECPSEQAAFLKENALLRKHRPPFNVLNTRPESYFFIGFSSSTAHFRFRLTTEAEKNSASEKLFGVFRSRSLTRQGYGSLLRLLWAILTHEGESSRFEFPAALVRSKISPRFRIKVKDTLAVEKQRSWQKLIEDFFNGNSDTLLGEMTEALLEKEEIPPFYYHLIQDDLKSLKSFYQFGPYRNQCLKLQNGIQADLLPQDQIDDLLVDFRMRQDSVES